MDRCFFNRTGFGLFAGLATLFGARAARATVDDPAMSCHRTCMLARALVVMAGLVALGGPIKAEDLASGWSVDVIEAPVGEAKSCAATKMTGTDRGIGFTRLASGTEFLTVAVEGWSYAVGDELSERVTVGDAAPYELKAFGQNNATLAKGAFSTDPALKVAKTVEIAIGDTHATFDVQGLDKAFEALRTCVLPKV